MRLRLPVALALLLALAPAALAQTAPTVLTPERLWQIARVGGPAVSPDGQHAVYSVTTPDAAANRTSTQLWRVPTAGGAPVQLTEAGGREPEWMPDGRVAYLSSESGSAQVWTMAADGTDRRALTAVEGGVETFRVAPAGRRIALVRRVQVDPRPADRHPDLPLAEARIHDDLMVRHWGRWTDGTYRQLFVGDLRPDGTVGPLTNLLDGQRVGTPLEPFGGREHVAWHPDGERIAYTAKTATGVAYATGTDSDIFLFDLRTGRATNLTEGNRGYDVEPAFSPDGRRLAYNSMETPGYEADRNRVFVLDLQTGERQELTEGFDGNANHPTWMPDGLSLLATTETDGTVQLVSLSVAPGTGVRVLTEGAHNVGAFSVGGAARRPVVVAERQSMIVPTDLYRVDAGRFTQLTTQGEAGLAGLDRPTVHARRVPTTDGQTMLVWEIRPPGFDAARRYPAVLYMQGGPQSALSQFFSYRWNFHALAAQGYVVVAPNRRGMPGHGTAWNAQISQDWGGQAMTDLLSASDAVAAEPYVDRERMAAIGASFGGYSAFWLAGNHAGRFRTFVAHAGIFHLESMYASTEELFFVNHDLGGPFWQTSRPPSYDRFSPHAFVDRWDRPMLITHGDLDYRVPVEQSLQAYTALRLRGLEGRLVTFPGENHWIVRPQNSLLWHREVYGWLARHLAP